VNFAVLIEIDWNILGCLNLSRMSESLFSGFCRTTKNVACYIKIFCEFGPLFAIAMNFFIIAFIRQN